ncbi:N-acetylmuramoyl-L-alanine amidase [Streptomyces sp. NPDC059016]|uniref:peptidoglycan recognition protein family protein n=1 Tax=Streptomyces sp. NPDC059016 TaxID=3346699 RepID=UPI0036C6CCE3
MAWYPGAIKMELQPESDAQPAIRPTQFIVHSIVAPWTVRRTYEYWRDSTNLESHFGVDYAGDVGQYIGTETRADANAGANRRPDGTGAVSAETASNLQASDPWNDKQVEELIKLGVWLHQRHNIPLRICRTHDDPGYGYHSLFPQWSVGGTACPGAARKKQFRDVVFPGIVARAGGKTQPPQAPTGGEMALSTDDIRRIFETDGFLSSPDYDKDPTGNLHWSAESYLRNTYLHAREVRRQLATLRDIEAAVKRLEASGVPVSIQLTPEQIKAIAKAVVDEQHKRLAE